MTIKSTLSIVALVSGMALAGSAYAQTMVGNNDVSDADLPYVQAHCDALLLDEQNSSQAGVNPNEVPADEQSEEGETSTTNDDSQTGIEADTAARNSSTTVDLDTITLDDCVAAGLVER